MSTIATATINRGLRGLPGAVGNPGPQGAPGPASPGQYGALTTWLFGSSGDERNHVTIDGTIAVSGGVATIDLESAHLCHTGAWVSLGRPKATPGTIDARRITAQMTRVTDTRITVPVPGWPNGTGVTAVRLLAHYAPPSYIRRLNQELNGALDIAASHTGRGENTTEKIALGQVAQVVAGAPGLVIGAYGGPNDILDGVTAATKANITTMVDAFNASGAVCVICMPPIPPEATVDQVTAVQRQMEEMQSLRRTRPRLLLLDEAAMTVDPMTGQGRPELFRGYPGTSDIHSNADYSNTKGAALAALLAPLIAPAPSPLVRSIWDRRSEDPNSRQIVDGFWSTAGLIAANTLDNRSTGNVDPGIFDIRTLGSSGRGAAFSMELRGDGCGYDLVCVFTGNAGDAIELAYTGEAGQTFGSRLVADSAYNTGCALTINQSAPGVLGAWEHYIEATYAGNIQARLSSHMRPDDDIVDPPPLDDIEEVPAIFPPAVVGPGAVVSVAKWMLGARLAATGSITIRWGRLTMRQRLSA